MNFIIKNSPRRIDPKHPESTDPSWRQAYEAGQRLLKSGKVKFESEAEERDYYRRIRSNPGNVPGLPEFFPPLKIGPFTVPKDVKELKQKRQLRWEPWRDIELYCRHCEKVTLHYIDNKGGYCHKCATPISWHI